MNTAGIDTLMRVSAPVAKPAPTETPRESGEFERHLRQAAAPQSETPQPKTQRKAPSEAPTTDQAVLASDQEETPTANQDQAPVEQVEGVEVEIVVAEGEHAAIEPDEVLLSVAATAIEEAAPIIVAPSAAAEEIVVTVAASLPAPALAANTDQPANDSIGAQLAQLVTDAGTDGVEQAIEEAVVPTNAAAEPTIVTHGEVAEPWATQEISVESTFDQPTSKPVDTAAIEVTKAEAVQQQTIPEAPRAPALTAVNSVVAVPPVQPAVKPLKTEELETSGDEPTKPTTTEKPMISIQAVSASLFVDPNLFEKADSGTTRDVESPSPSPPIHTPSNTYEGTQPTQPQLGRSEVPAGVEQRDADSRMPTIDRARFVQRVANAFRSAQQNDGHIQLRLSPPELGSLKIEIAVRQGVLTANLETETSDARRVLLDNLPALRQRLAEQDIRIDKFEVDIRREGGQPDGQASAQDRQAQQQSQRAAAQNRVRTPQQTEVISTRVPRPAATIADANLDVRI